MVRCRLAAGYRAAEDSSGWRGCKWRKSDTHEARISLESKGYRSQKGEDSFARRLSQVGASSAYAN